MRRATRLRHAAVAAVALLAAGLAGCGDDEPATPPASRAADPPAASWRGFGPGAWPAAAWRPYADASPFNRPIPDDVDVHPRSREIVARMLSLGAPSPSPIVAGSSGTSDDYAHPTYWARGDDPLYTLEPLDDRGPSEIRGMRIPIPEEARPAPGGDGHMTVVTPDGWEYDFWEVRPRPSGGGTLAFSWGGRLRIDGDGLGGEATASGFGLLAGVIRAPELAAGRIDHALFLVVRCTSAGASFGYGVRNSGVGDGDFVYPAAAGDARCEPDPGDAPPMGARVQLAMSEEQIGALGVPAWKRGILHALATYGGYVGDTGGPGLGIQLESGLTYTAFGYPDPFVELGEELTGSALGVGGAAAVSAVDGRYLFDVASGVDWERHLRVVAPPRSG